MAASPTPATRHQLHFTRRKILLLGSAVGTLIVGYLWLKAGGTTGAAVLLVLGYCVLFPLGIAL